MNQHDLDFVCALVRVRSGMVLGGERAFVVETRLGPLARREKLASVEDLIRRVRDDPAGALARATIEAMAVQESSFFRDRQAFAALQHQVLPSLGAGKATLRLWSAGCAQGQEAYSLAMLVAEAEGALPPVEILASDLSTAALEKAQTGVYTHFEVQRGLAIRRLLEHFDDLEDAWRVRPALRGDLRWMRLNLIDSFKVQDGYDIILCRNVLSSFAADARAAVLAKLDGALVPGGRLMLGAGEPAPEHYRAIDGAPCVFGREAEVPQVEAAA